uniref:RxLR effector candidate protein n=1 Tax=Peronospora matthiolae TaxID=2874970 RepID=A0AAV1VJP0_9STRA
MLLPLGGLPQGHDFDSWLVKETKRYLDGHDSLFKIWLRKSLTPEYVEAAFKEAGKADHDSAKFLVGVYKKMFDVYREQGWVLMADEVAAQAKLLKLSGMGSHENFGRWLKHVVNEEDINLRGGLFDKWLDKAKHPDRIAGMFKEAGKAHDTGVQDLIKRYRTTFDQHEQADRIVILKQQEVQDELVKLSGKTGHHKFDAWLTKVVSEGLVRQEHWFEKWLIDGKSSKWFARKFEEAGKADHPNAKKFLRLFEEFEEKRRRQFYSTDFEAN